MPPQGTETSRKMNEAVDEGITVCDSAVTVVWDRSGRTEGERV